MGPSHRAGLGYNGQGDGSVLGSWGGLDSFLAMLGHAVPGQPLRAIKTWVFSGPQQDVASMFQNKDSAFLGHRSFENLTTVHIHMLSPEKMHLYSQLQGIAETLEPTGS